MSRPVVPIDWDGTLVRNEFPDPGEWKEGAVDFLKDLIKRGCVIVIHSCRSSWPEGYAEIREKLDDAGLEGVAVWLKEGKPIGAAYVDDRAVNAADSDWARMTREILELCDR